MPIDPKQRLRNQVANRIKNARSSFLRTVNPQYKKHILELHKRGFAVERIFKRLDVVPMSLITQVISEGK